MSDLRSLGSKYKKEQHQILVKFGYAFDGLDSAGHLRYVHPSQPPLLGLSATPRNEFYARKRLLAELRKRHPNHSMWLSSQTARKRRVSQKRRKMPARAALPRPAVPTAKIPTPPGMVAISRLECASCGYVWRSDLGGAGRPCPGCDGVIEWARVLVPRCPERLGWWRCARPEGHLDHHAADDGTRRWPRRAAA